MEKNLKGIKKIQEDEFLPVLSPTDQDRDAILAQVGCYLR